ncbi:hypothetical protein SETIT_4G292400v2 [Setaria italica]|uniref:Uncharacterized protein n=1 Tax=Setaria italica TaxID=4555 RepID=A0A368R1D9_SETIT|nr:hypothetical protein SETIT_4G292400v2 [Setaria italica]
MDVKVVQWCWGIPPLGCWRARNKGCSKGSRVWMRTKGIISVQDNAQCVHCGRQRNRVRMGCGGVLRYGYAQKRRCGISRYIIPFYFFLLLSKAAPVFPLLGAAGCYRFGLEHPL